MKKREFHINFYDFPYKFTLFWRVHIKTYVNWAQELSLSLVVFVSPRRYLRFVKSFLLKTGIFLMSQRCKSLGQVKIFVAIAQITCDNIYEKLRRKTSYEEKDHYPR